MNNNKNAFSPENKRNGSVSNESIHQEKVTVHIYGIRWDVDTVTGINGQEISLPTEITRDFTYNGDIGKLEEIICDWLYGEYRMNHGGFKYDIIQKREFIPETDEEKEMLEIISNILKDAIETQFNASKKNEACVKENTAKCPAYVETNIGRIPIDEYRDLIAINNGFDNYDDMFSQGYRLGNCYDKDEPTPCLETVLKEATEAEAEEEEEDKIESEPLRNFYNTISYVISPLKQFAFELNQEIFQILYETNQKNRLAGSDEISSLTLKSRNGITVKFKLVDDVMEISTDKEPSYVEGWDIEEFLCDFPSFELIKDTNSQNIVNDENC